MENKKRNGELPYENSSEKEEGKKRETQRGGNQTCNSRIVLEPTDMRTEVEALHEQPA